MPLTHNGIQQYSIMLTLRQSFNFMYIFTVIKMTLNARISSHKEAVLKTESDSHAQNVGTQQNCKINHSKIDKLAVRI